MSLLAPPQVSPPNSKLIDYRLNYMCLESIPLRFVLLYNKGMALEGSSAAQLTVNLDETKSIKQEETESNTNAFTNDPSESAPSIDVNDSIPDKISEEEYTLFGSSSTSSLLTRMTKPESQDIKKWMAQTQETVDNEVTNWQHMLLRNTAHVSTLLDQLAQFLICLDGNVYSKSDKSNSSPRSSFLLAAKYPNDNGAFESAINIYLHVITLVITELRNSLESEKHSSKQLRQHSIQLLKDFSSVAEDALKFFRTHDKYLRPILSRVLEMRNDFFLSLRPVIYDPSVRIIPLANVSLEKIHMEEDAKWLTKQEQYSSPSNHSTCFPHIQIRVGSRDCFIQKSRGDHAATEDETTTVEKLELVKILLKQLSISFATSNLECEDSQYLSGVCTRLAKRFDAFLRNIETEARKNRLKPDTCCSFLKESLCHLEVKFHQVERILEEIPEHIRRVIGVADFCTRQLVVSLGHTPLQHQPLALENLEEYDDLAVPPECATSIESVSKEFFKPKLSLMRCFPILWKLVAKILGGSGNHSRRKLKEFWEQVRSELEDFQKEVKVKEMDANYSLTLTIPVFQEETEPIIAEPVKMVSNEVVTEQATEDEEIVQHSPIVHNIEITNEKAHETKQLGESNANYDNNIQLSFQFTTDFPTDNVQNK